MVANTRSTSAAAALVAILLSTTLRSATTALAAVPEDAGMALSVEPRAAPPEVRPLAQSAIQGQRFAAEDGRVLELLLADGTSLTLASGGALTIDDFAFDPGASSDRLHLTLEQGLLAGRGRPPGLRRAGGRDHACGRGQARPWRRPGVRRRGRHHPHRPPVRRPADHDRGGRDRGSGPAGLRDGHDPRCGARIAGAPARGRDRGRHGGAQPRPAGGDRPRRRRSRARPDRGDRRHQHARERPGRPQPEHDPGRRDHGTRPRARGDQSGG